MKDLKIIFRNLQSKLEQSSWFADGWEIYNRGVYLQLYKDTWFNDSQGGVHFETYIEAPQLRQKAFPICMHAEEDCPSQQIFIRDFLDSDGEKIRSWKGYDVMGDGYSICQRVLPLNFKNLEHRLYEEFNRLRQLEPGVDRILRTLQQ